MDTPCCSQVVVYQVAELCFCHQVFPSLINLVHFRKPKWPPPDSNRFSTEAPLLSAVTTALMLTFVGSRVAGPGCPRGRLSRPRAGRAWGSVLCLAAAVCVACSEPADGKGGKDELRELLAQAKKLGRTKDAAKRVQLLKQATELDSASVEAARELALASAHLLMGPRLPDDPTKAPTKDAVVALERFRYRSMPARPPACSSPFRHAR